MDSGPPPARPGPGTPPGGPGRCRAGTDTDTDTGGERPRAERGERPRDALGRPLPRGARGVTPLPDGPALPPRVALATAQDLLDAGLFFQAHEVLEAVWKAAPDPERGLWRGLTQLVVGLTHAARGNATGAAALLRRGLRELTPYLREPGETGPPARWAEHRVDLPGLARWAADLATAVETGGAPADPAAWTPRLVARPDRP